MDGGCFNEKDDEMMDRRAYGILVLFLTAPPGAAQKWEQVGDQFVLKVGDGQIAYRAPGVIAVGRQGDFPLQVAFFLWHDNWVYERLEAGTVLRGPELDEQGWIRQTGTWVVREQAPPMKYALALEPLPPLEKGGPGGVKIHLETEKTAELKLTAGLWCVLALEPAPPLRKGGPGGVKIDEKGGPGGVKAENREPSGVASVPSPADPQIYARPSAHGPWSRSLLGVCEALLVELSAGRAAVFQGEGFREIRHQAGGSIEMNLHPQDFPVGEKARTSLTIGFEDLPTEFPGEIKPQRRPLAIGQVTPSATTVPQFGKIELEVDLSATWDNPFDPDDVALDAVLTTASGKELRLPGFFLVDHQRSVKGGVELMLPQGQGRWLVRLAATEVGPLHCTLVAQDRTGTVRREVGPFTVVAGENKGFLRVSRHDPRYLQFDSGAAFIPIGHNLPIYHTSGQLAEEAIRKMAAAGENYNRWWMSNAGLGLEWEEKLGWYRQAQAARLDFLLDLAEELDFYYMLCLDTHQDFREDGWQGNPFNQANGGPCATVQDWFTNEAARTFYKKRLRYIVARWGYSPHVLCWEFGNEFEGWADTPEEVKIEWHREMAAYLAALDPYQHLITTSWWSHTGPEKCWEIPEMGLVQTHCYTNNDANVAEPVRQYCLHQWNRFEKPHLFGEFGIRSHTTTADKDPQGWALHNANWAAVCSGCCGIPMPWWHENYIDPLNLYFHFTAIAHFVQGLPFGTARWEPVTVGEMEYVRPPERPLRQDITLTPTSRWGQPEVNEFHVRPDGSVNDPPAIHELLHGMGHQDLRNPPTFVVDYPQPGQFLMNVGRVSNSGRLKVWLDGELKLEREFPCGENVGKEWKYQPQWNLWESVYDEDVAIDVPAGKHRITVDNLGKDWMQVRRFVFTGCKTLDRPNLLVAALRSSEVAIVWLQNRDSDWFNHQKNAVPSVPPSRVPLLGFSDGDYEVEWWETWKGAPVRRERITAQDGTLLLQPGEVATDVAAKIRRGP